MDTHDQAAHEVLDTAAAWARDRTETRALMGAVLDSITGYTPNGDVIAVMNPEIVADLRRRVGH